MNANFIYRYLVHYLFKKKTLNIYFL